MKITEVRAHVLRSKLEQPFAFSQGWVEVPQRPGLGIEVSREVVKEYSA